MKNILSLQFLDVFQRVFSDFSERRGLWNPRHLQISTQDTDGQVDTWCSTAHAVNTQHTATLHMRYMRYMRGVSEDMRRWVNLLFEDDAVARTSRHLEALAPRCCQLRILQPLQQKLSALLLASPHLEVAARLGLDAEAGDWDPGRCKQKIQIDSDRYRMSGECLLES